MQTFLGFQLIELSTKRENPFTAININHNPLSTTDKTLFPQMPTMQKLYPFRATTTPFTMSSSSKFRYYPYVAASILCHNSDNHALTGQQQGNQHGLSEPPLLRQDSHCRAGALIAERELSTRELYPLAISQLDTAGEFARMKDTMLEMGYTNRLILRIQVVNQTPMFLVTVHPSFQKLKNVLATLKIHNSQNRNNKVVNFFVRNPYQMFYPLVSMMIRFYITKFCIKIQSIYTSFTTINSIYQILNK